MKDFKKYLNRDPAKGAVLIEILDDDRLVLHVNHTSKKVSIKHYPNNYMNGVGVDENQKERYPLYYRVIFNKQSVKIKSNIVRAYSKEEFDLNKLSKEDKKYIYREALVLTYIVSDTYVKTISEALKETEEDRASIEKSFDINHLFNNFSIHDYELPKIIEEKLLDMILNESENEPYRDEILNMFKYSSELNPYQLLQFLKFKNKPKWDEFENRFHPKIWFFNFYYYHFVKNHNEYEYVGVTALDLRYFDYEHIEAQYRDKNTLDYYSPELPFEEKFFKFYPEEEFSGLIYQIKLMILN